MRTLKWLFVGVVALAVVLVAGLVVALNVVDLNEYKGKIQEVAKQQTGRELSIPGDIGVSYFPWVGLTLGELSMANAESFGDADFVRIGGADVKIKLLALLKKSVEVKTVTLNGLHVDLQRAADGTTNWQDLLTAGEDAATPSGGTSNEQTNAAADDSVLVSFAVSGIEVSDASIRWTDAQNGTDVTLEKFNLTTSAIKPREPFEFTSDFSLHSDSVGINAQMQSAGKVSVDLEQQRYNVNQLQLQTNANGDVLPNGSASLKLAADVAADLAGGRVDIDALTLTALGVVLKGDIAVSDLNSAPAVVGTVQSENFNPTDVMAALGVAPLQSANDKVLKAGRLSASLKASASHVELSNLQINVDDTTLNGSLSVPDLTATVPPLRFDLTVDAIDVDRYLPKPASDAAPAEPATQSTAAAAQALDLPIDLIRDLDIDGVFRIADIKAANLRAKAILLPLVAKDGVIAAKGIAASLYEGTLSGNLGLDAHGETPAFNLGYQLAAIQAAPLLKDLLEDDAPISGQANVSGTLNTSGSSFAELKSTLAGDVSADFLDGSLNGINIGYQLRRAKSFLTANDEPVEESIVKTDFSALHLGATIASGIVSSSDLDVRSPGLRIGGEGTVDLPEELVDYTMKAKIVGSIEGQGGAELDDLKGLSVNIPVRGSFADLSTDFTGTIVSAMKEDYKNQAADRAQSLANAEAEKVKAEARARADAAEQEAREKLEAEKTRAQARLEAELEKYEEKSKIVTDELKDKARDKLKSFLK